MSRPGGRPTRRPRPDVDAPPGQRPAGRAGRGEEPDRRRAGTCARPGSGASPRRPDRWRRLLRRAARSSHDLRTTLLVRVGVSVHSGCHRPVPPVDARAPYTTASPSASSPNACALRARRSVGVARRRPRCGSPKWRSSRCSCPSLRVPRRTEPTHRGASACPRRRATACRRGRRRAGPRTQPSPGSSRSAATALAAVGGGQRERDVRAAGAARRDVLHDHVDVDVGGASSPKIAPPAPGLSGTPTTVTLASLRSCATPLMIACFHREFLQ